METVLIVIHLMIVVALVAIVLLQRSEGGALGIGGGGGLMTSRGSANLLTRSTAILAVAFFATSIGLTILARLGSGGETLIDVPAQSGPAVPSDTDSPPTGSGIIDQLRPSGSEGTSEVPGVPGAGSAPSNDVPTSQ
jgi:preprotein translocase subunit SecG